MAAMHHDTTPDLKVVGNKLKDTLEVCMICCDFEIFLSVGLYILLYMSYGYLRDCGSIWLYVISLTHIRHLTPLLHKNLKTMVLWAFILI